MSAKVMVGGYQIMLLIQREPRRVGGTHLERLYRGQILSEELEVARIRAERQARLLGALR